MANEPYNVNIETKAQLAEIQKLLSELRAIGAEISKINGQAFSAVSVSAAELSKTGKDLAKALVSQRIASEELNKMLNQTGNGFDKAKNKTKNFKDEVDSASTTVQGFYMELGAMGARMATHLPSAVGKTIQAFGRQEMATQKLSAAIRANGGEQVLEMQAMATSMGVNADHVHIVNSEEDRQRIMADAVKYADESIEKMREEKKLADSKASSEKWIAYEAEKSKAVQRALEYDILKARASRDESLAREREGKLRIAQLSAEIFENTRKEGMFVEDLKKHLSDANQQAQDRYNQEKSVTGEVERQNLAKDAQAKIEDILMANKIEQLKAEGKLTEAKEL